MSRESSQTPASSEPGASPRRDDLQGWIPELAAPEEVRIALEHAFDYRGDVTITLKNGDGIEGYVFDRRAEGLKLEQCWVRIIPKQGGGKIAVRYSDIARLEFTGRDMASGKSFELWLQKYHEKKARGETNISLEPEALE